MDLSSWLVWSGIAVVALLVVAATAAFHTSWSFTSSSSFGRAGRHRHVDVPPRTAVSAVATPLATDGSSSLSSSSSSACPPVTDEHKDLRPDGSRMPKHPKWADRGRLPTTKRPTTMLETSTPFNNTLQQCATKFKFVALPVANMIQSGSSAWSRALQGFLIGGRTLSEADVTPILAKLHDTLITRNVAVDVATQLCDSAKTALLVMEQPSLTRVQTVVRSCVRQRLDEILAPSMDLLETILARRQRQEEEPRRVYSIALIGSNGIGKTTTLAKLAAYLSSHDVRVGLVAGDTFRAGAIEQLKTHAQALQVPLYAQGYDRDPASVAMHGIQQATRDKCEVVLIDTAGRQQTNEPLMRSLAKLVRLNKPDLIVLTAEALVGNDLLDQVTAFNRALAEHGGVGDSQNEAAVRTIDAILLTKFDCVDDRVGGAVTLMHATRKPILFVGTGQRYQDLHKLEPDHLVDILLA